MNSIMDILFGMDTPLSDNSGIVYWWHTPLGFGAILILAVVSAVNIFHRGINDGLFIRVYYWVLLVLSMVSILHVIENTVPRHQLQLLLITFIIKSAYGTIRRLVNHKKTGEPQDNND